MAEVTKLKKELSQKCDTLQEDVDNFKKCGVKQKKKKTKHYHHRPHSKFWTQSQSRSRSSHGVHLAYEKESLRETHLYIAKAAQQIFGEEHVTNLMTKGCLPVLQQ